MVRGWGMVIRIFSVLVVSGCLRFHLSFLLSGASSVLRMLSATDRLYSTALLTKLPRKNSSLAHFGTQSPTCRPLLTMQRVH